MHTRRRVLATTGTALSTLALPAVPVTAIAAGESRFQADDRVDATTPLGGSDDHTFVDLQAVRDAETVSDDAVAALEDRVADETKPVGVDGDEVLAYASGVGYASLTGTFDAFAVRLQLLFGSYDGVGEYAGFDCYVDEERGSAVAVADGELFLTTETLATREGLTRTIDVATGADETGDGSDDRSHSPASNSGQDPIGVIHEVLGDVDEVDSADVVRTRRISDEDSPPVAGVGAVAVTRRFDAGATNSNVRERRLYAFDRPGRIPLPAVDQYVRRTSVFGDTEGDIRVELAAGGRCAVASVTVAEPAAVVPGSA